MLDKQDCFIQFLVGIQDEPGHVFLFLQIHPRHGFVQNDKLGVKGQSASELYAFLDTVGQGTDCGLANMLNFPLNVI